MLTLTLMVLSVLVFLLTVMVSRKNATFTNKGRPISKYTGIDNGAYSVISFLALCLIVPAIDNGDISIINMLMSLSVICVSLVVSVIATIKK